jgi:hypothetical protein
MRGCRGVDGDCGVGQCWKRFRLEVDLVAIFSRRHYLSVIDCHGVTFKTFCMGLSYKQLQNEK